MKHKEILLITSESNLNFDRFFDGFAFFENDLVIGNSGFQSFYEECDKFDLYEDGNYLVIDKVRDDKFIVSRDYHGYYPLFYYDSGDYWCISNSIIYMAEHLSRKGISLTYNEPNVEMWKLDLLFTQQLTSHSTFINEINVVPVNRDIVLVDDGLNKNISLCKRKKEYVVDDSYDSALKKCLEIWRSRYLTILSNQEMALHHELTGGLDSRSLFSFIARCKESAIENQKTGRLRVHSHKHQVADFEVATRLASLFELEVNTHTFKKFKSENISAEESYAVWKYFNLGRYSPTIFPATEFKPKLMELGGEGGEDNRNFYGRRADGSVTEFSKYIESYKKYFSSPERYIKWANQIDQACSILEEDTSLDVSIMHYKQFRSNNHTSKNPRSRLRFAVLGSKYFDQLSQLASLDAMVSGQILYDITYNNCNKLLYIPYDEEHKTMNDDNIKNLPVINIDNSDEGGKVYWSNQEGYSEILHDLPIKLNSKSYNSALEILHDNALKSLQTNKDLISNYFGDSFIIEFEDKFKSIDFKSSKINLHKKGSFLHALVLIDFMSTISQ